MANEPEPVVGSVGAATSCTVAERTIGDLAVLAVSGSLDVLTTPELEAGIAAAAQRPSAGLIVDLSAVEFLGSSGMGALVTAHAYLSPDTRLALVADGPATSRPLTLVGIADVIDIFATLDEAVSALSS